MVSKIGNQHKDAECKVILRYCKACDQKQNYCLNETKSHWGLTSTNVLGRPEGSYLKFYKCLNYIFNNNTFSPI